MSSSAATQALSPSSVTVAIQRCSSIVLPRLPAHPDRAAAVPEVALRLFARLPAPVLVSADPVMPNLVRPVVRGPQPAPPGLRYAPAMSGSALTPTKTPRLF